MADFDKYLDSLAAKPGRFELFNAVQKGEATDKTLLLLTCIDLRYLPPKEQIDAVRGAAKRSFIAGTTVSGNVPDTGRRLLMLGSTAF